MFFGAEAEPVGHPAVAYPVTSYDKDTGRRERRQDRDECEARIEDGGLTVRLVGNGWKKIALPGLNLTPRNRDRV